MSAKALNSEREAALLLHTLMDRGQDSLTSDDYVRMAQIAHKKGYHQVAREFLDCANDLLMSEQFILLV